MDPNFPSQLQFSNDTVIPRGILNMLRRREAQCGLCTIAMAKRMTSTVFCTYTIQSKERIPQRKPSSPQNRRKHRRRRIYRTRACLQLSVKQHLRRIGLFPNQLVERFFPDQHALQPQQDVPTKITFSASHRGILHQALRRHLDVQITGRRSKAALMLPSKAKGFILSHRAYTTTSTLRFIPARQTHMGPPRILFLNRKLIKRFGTTPLRIWRASSTPC